MYLLSGYVKCLNCKGRYKGRNERNKNVYLYSYYAQYSKQCIRYVIHELDILKIVEAHLKLKGIKIGESLCEHLLSIEVDPIKKGYEIYYEDGTKSFVSNDDKLGIKYKL